MHSVWEIIKALLGTASIGAVITSGVTLARFLKELRLKAQAEKRLAESATIENQIKLVKLFTELMNLANARGNSELSEKAVEILLQRDRGADVETALKTAVVIMPVGAATQDAAIAAIAELGATHAVLRACAVQALESLCSFKPLAGEYLAKLKAKP